MLSWFLEQHDIFLKYKVLLRNRHFLLITVLFSVYLIELDDCTIFLWLLSVLAEDPCMDPHAVLRGHTGGVTCLAFSPDGGQLLSGGKDQVQYI